MLGHVGNKNNKINVLIISNWQCSLPLYHWRAKSSSIMTVCHHTHTHTHLNMLSNHCQKKSLWYQKLCLLIITVKKRCMLFSFNDKNSMIFEGERERAQSVGGLCRSLHFLNHDLEFTCSGRKCRRMLVDIVQIYKLTFMTLQPLNTTAQTPAAIMTTQSNQQLWCGLKVFSFKWVI